jgi:hypothetical protein
LFSEAFGKLDRFGDCVASGDTNLPLPLLRVPGVEAPIAWPLPPAQARELQAIGTATGPFAWHISGALTMSNPLWAPAVAALAKSAAESLGVPGAIDARPAHLHLVASGSGAINAPHSVPDDARKAGAFGVLVLVLPALHEGGRLVVAHGGKVKTLETEGELNACTVVHPRVHACVRLIAPRAFIAPRALAAVTHRL